MGVRLALHRLNAAQVRAAKTPGYLPDGGGLILQVSRTGSKSWIYRYRVHGRLREMGLGSASIITLAEARRRAAKARAQLVDGIDPLAARDADRRDRRKVAAQRIRFREAIPLCMAVVGAHWKGGQKSKHAAQWRRTLDEYAKPLMHMDVSDIDTEHVGSCLRDIWHTKAETAGRTRQRIEAVLSWATASGYRTGLNPARWAGHLDKVLGEQRRDVKHFASLPYDQCGDFLRNLRSMNGTAARALELLVLTGTRSGEVRGAAWGEFDLDAALWIIPAARTKAKREHRVPLSIPAANLLRTLKGESNPAPDWLVFPSPRRLVMSDMSMAAVLVRMGHAKGKSFTVHGFRSSLRIWLTEQTTAPVDVAESVLAHERRGAVQRAYERTDFLEQRRPLMQAWADYLNHKPADNVVEMPDRRGTANG